MEAENKESQDLKMDPDVNIRKPLRARKTMTPSSRKQVEILKNLHGLGTPGSGTYSADDYVQLKMIETECINYSSSKEPDPDLGSKETPAKEPLAKLVVNSEISIYDGSPDVPRGLPYNGCIADTNVKQFLSAGSLRDLLCTFYEKEPGSNPVEEHLYSKTANWPLDRPKEPASSPSSFPRDTPTLGKTEKVEEMPRKPVTAVLKQENDNFQFREGNTLPDDALRERRTSGREEEISCKQVSSSYETGAASPTQSEKSQSGLEKVRGLIQSHIDNSMGDLDRKLQQLNERIDHTQCLRKHEEITIRIIKKISRLDRHVNSVVDHQRAQLSKKVNLPGAQPKTTILNVDGPLPSSPNDPSIPLKRRSVQPGEVPSKTTRSSAKETCLDMKSSSMEIRNSADVQEKRAPSNAQPHVEAPSSAQPTAEAPCAPKAKVLIDLTEEEDPNTGEEVSVKVHLPPEGTASKPCQPTTEPPKEEIPVQFSHLPPLPKIRLHPQHANSFKGTLPPQKLELDVALVQNPKGIALQWNVREVDPRCAPIESFHLFIYLEGKTTGAQSSWIKTNKIKALPLPMACSLSQFRAPGKCYFAMQSEDIYGRFGPFCDIQSISAI